MSIMKLYRKVNLFLKKAENKKYISVILLSLVIVVSFIIYAGHFLFTQSGDTAQKKDPAAPLETSAAQNPISGTGKTPEADAVRYIHKTEEINGLKQEINILEVDPGAAGVQIQPVLSHDIIYGFEILSEMAARKKAYAAATGGFFSKYGLPSGMVMIDGELISASTGKYPVFIAEIGKAMLKDFKSSISVEYWRAGVAGISGSATSGRFAIDSFNVPAGLQAVAIYTPYYGQTNRADRPNVTAVVEGGIVTKTAFYNNEAEIPQKGILISFFDTAKYSVENFPIKVGDSIKLSHQPEIGADADAYECGSWLLRDGKVVVPEKDAWIGVLTNRDPRTAIGIKEDGTVVLLTVDGRQPGYSAGFTGQELAEYLIGCGVKNAAMLDGGASTEMLVGGKLVSRPSYKGEERTLGGGILVLTGK